MADELDEEERELLRKHRETKAAQNTDPDDFEYEIGRGDNYARVHAKSRAGQKVRAFFRDSFGIDLDDEPVQDDDEPGAEPKAKPAGKPELKAFRGGRRVG